MIPPITPSSSPCEIPVPSSPLPQAHSHKSHVLSVTRVQPTGLWNSFNSHSSTTAVNAFSASSFPITRETHIFTNTIVAATTTIVRLGTGETPTNQTLVIMQAAESRERVIVGLAASTSVLAGFIVGYLVHRVRRRFLTRQREMGKLKIAECKSKGLVPGVTEEVPSSPPQTRSINSTQSMSENSSPLTVSPNSPQSIARDGTGSNNDPFDDIRRASKTSSLPSYRSADPE